MLAASGMLLQEFQNGVGALCAYIYYMCVLIMCAYTLYVCSIYGAIFMCSIYVLSIYYYICTIYVAMCSYLCAVYLLLLPSSFFAPLFTFFFYNMSIIPHLLTPYLPTLSANPLSVNLYIYQASLRHGRLEPSTPSTRPPAHQPQPPAPATNPNSKTYPTKIVVYH